MHFGKTRVVLKKGDITHEAADIIVNAANSGLMGGGGVDGAIHRVGGSSILEECRRIRQERGRCPTGEAVITNAGNLKARKLIHAVGPQWHGGKFNEPELLESTYRSVLLLAKKAHAKSVVFPSISTGVFNYPIEKASLIALQTVKNFVEEEGDFQEVRFILFSDDDLKVYEEVLQSMMRK